MLFTERGLQNAPGVAREQILEAAKSALATADVGGGGKKARKNSGGNGGAAALEAVVARGGQWEERELLVVNPEGEDAEEAKDRLLFMQAKVRCSFLGYVFTGAL
jgi:hypothetical protein